MEQGNNDAGRRDKHMVDPEVDENSTLIGLPPDTWRDRLPKPENRTKYIIALIAVFGAVVASYIGVYGVPWKAMPNQAGGSQISVTEEGLKTYAQLAYDLKLAEESKAQLANELLETKDELARYKELVVTNAAKHMFLRDALILSLNWDGLSPWTHRLHQTMIGEAEEQKNYITIGPDGNGGTSHTGKPLPKGVTLEGLIEECENTPPIGYPGEEFVYIEGECFSLYKLVFEDYPKSP